MVVIDKLHKIIAKLSSDFNFNFSLKLTLHYFRFIHPPNHHPPIRTSSDINLNFSLYNFQARAMLGSSMAS